MMFGLITFALCLSRLASAYLNVLESCAGDGTYMDPVAQTSEIRPFNLQGLSTLGVDSNSEKELECAQMSLVENKDIILIYTGLDKEGNSVLYLGNVTFSPNKNYLTVSRVDRSELPREYADAPDSAVNVNWSPAARLYISFFSETEIVLTTCKPKLLALFGTEYYSYIYTSQPTVYTEVDSACLAETVAEFPDLKRFDYTFQTPEKIMYCESANEN